MKLLALITTTLALLGTTRLATATPLDLVEVDVTPSTIDVDLGERATIDVAITNRGDTDVHNVVAHIDITDLDEGGSVDPEDWSSTLSRRLGTIPFGQTRTVSWDLQPISPGTFTLYAVALSNTSETVAASQTVTIEVADRRSLNPNGILPVAIAAPVLIGTGLGLRVRRNRR